jgi:hypothetical protein
MILIVDVDKASKSEMRAENSVSCSEILKNFLSPVFVWRTDQGANDPKAPTVIF